MSITNSISAGFFAHYYVAIILPIAASIVALAITRSKFTAADWLLFAAGSATTYATAFFSPGGAASHLVCAYAVFAITHKLIEAKRLGLPTERATVSDSEIAKFYSLSFYSLLIADLASPLPSALGADLPAKIIYNLRNVGGAGWTDGLLWVPVAIAAAFLLLRSRR